MPCKVALPLESVNEFQLCVIYQIKATEQYFSVVLYILLNKVIPSFDSVDEILKYDHSIMKATEQYFTVVLLILRYQVIFSFVSADEILKYDHSNEL